MSSNELQQVTLLSDYNSNGVINALQIRPEETLKIAAIRYLLKSMAEEGGYHHERAQNAKMAAESAANLLSYKLELLDSCKDSFFKGKAYDYDALIVAIILDDLLANIHVSSPDEDDLEENSSFIIPGISSEVLARAGTFFEMAGDLIDNGPAHSDASIEAHFIAIANSIHNVDDYIEDIEEYSEGRLREIYSDELPKLKELAKSKNDASKTLRRFISQLEEILPDFEQKRIFKRLEISPSQKLERACIKLLHEELTSEFSTLPPVFAHKEAENSLYDKTEYLLSLSRTYTKDYFQDGDYDPDILTAAIILDTLLADSESVIEKSNIDGNIINAAALIFDEAVDLAVQGYRKADDIEPETLVLAKFHAVSDLYNYLEVMDKATPDATAKIKERLINIEKFPLQDSQIDVKLADFIKQVKEDIASKQPEAIVLPFNSAARKETSLAKDFTTATIIPLRLPANIQNVLDDYNFKPNKPVRDILSSFSKADDAEMENIIRDTISTSNLIDHFGESTFAYRQGRISPSIYYANTAPGLSIFDPKLFPNLPTEYSALVDEIKNLSGDPELMYDNNISPDAKFCHKIQTYKSLNKFLVDLRSGVYPLDSEQGERNAAQKYTEHVSDAYNTISDPDTLSEAIGFLIKEINFIYNNFNHGLCGFVTTGMEMGEGILNRDSIYKLLPNTGTVDNRKTFDAVFDSFYEIHGVLNYNFYYDFAQKIITPINIFNKTHHNISQNQLDFLLAYAHSCCAQNLPDLNKNLKQLLQSCRDGDPDQKIMKKLEITTQDLEDFDACVVISNLTFTRLYIDGSFAIPVYDSYDIFDFHSKLSGSEKLMVTNPLLAPVWDACRRNAVECMNALIESNSDIAETFAPFPAPHM